MLNAFLHWLSSREGITFALSLTAGLWGLIRGKNAYHDKQLNRKEVLKELARQIYHQIEHMDSAGIFGKGIVTRGDDKWRKFYELFRDSMRAMGLGETTKSEEQWLNNLVSRWAWLSKPCKHPDIVTP